MEWISAENRWETMRKHYSSSHKILLVGEGDFSFSVCLAKAFGFAFNMVATSLDSREDVLSKYRYGATNLRELEELGCNILHGVNASNMSHHPDLRLKSFDRIVFNFPHAGFPCDEVSDESIRCHQEVVREFLRNARELVADNGEIHITHKTTYPFSEWKIEELGNEVGLRLIEEEEFMLSDYPGYENKKGDGFNCDKPFPVGRSSTFKFELSTSFYLNFISPPTPVTPSPTYLLKPIQTFISFIEPEYKGSSFSETIQNIFPKDFFFISSELLKTRIFYEFILVDTKSVEITHLRNNNDPQIVYSKFKILHVVSPSVWNQSLHTEKNFSQTFTPQSYSYHDYQMAWYNVFWLNNNSHFWFIQFHQNFKSQLPFWFSRWWSIFGTSEKIFPLSILNSFTYFKGNLINDSFDPLLYFSLIFHIPWIFRWKFSNQKEENFPAVFRIYKIKWCDKFNINTVQKSTIDQYFDTCPQLRNPKSQQISSFLAFKYDLMAALASASTAAEFNGIIQQVLKDRLSTRSLASSLNLAEDEDESCFRIK